MNHLLSIAGSLSIVFLVSACDKEKMANACTTDHPTERVIWLKRKVADLEKSPYCNTIRRFNYRGQGVFVVGTCEPNFNSVDQIYDCNGKLLCGWGDQQCPDFSEEAVFEEVVWPTR